MKGLPRPSSLRMRLVVIFLDIDGVLLPFGDEAPQLPPGTLFNERSLASLSQLLAAPLPGGARAQLVLSSTWRARQAFIDDILAEFRRYAASHPDSPLLHLAEAGRFYDTTSICQFSTRQHEIATWLDRRQASKEPAPDAWVCLDDEELLLGEACSTRRHEFAGHVVKTQSHVGLTPELAQEAVALLRLQLAEENQPDVSSQPPSTDLKRCRESYNDVEPHRIDRPCATEDDAELGCMLCGRDCSVRATVQLQVRFACPKTLTSGECDLAICTECGHAMHPPPSCREHGFECDDLFGCRLAS